MEGGAGRSEGNSARVKRTRQSVPERNLLRSATCISYANEEGFPEAGPGCAARGWLLGILQPGSEKQCGLEQHLSSGRRRGYGRHAAADDQ